MARLNYAKRRLEEGKPITILVVTMPSIAHAQLWARSGIDVLIFDLEHGVIDLSSLHAMIAATAGTEVTPMVRVPWNVHWLVKPVLDAGALGVMFPLVATAQDVERAVSSMYYPPRGDRGWGPFMAQYRWGVPHHEYVTAANDEMLTFIQVERPEAVGNLDSIVEVPGVDMFVISRHDLSTSMGKIASPVRALDPEAQQAVDEVEAKLLAAGAPVAGLTRDVEAAMSARRKGYQGLILGFDWMLLERSVGPAAEMRRRIE